MLNLAEVLLTARKQAGITQQALAEFLGVSKASVSKWETGQSYPDITLLPLIAAYFDLTVDQLIGYSAQLADEQIGQLYQRLQAGFSTRRASAVYQEAKHAVQRYYACAPLVLAMGLLVLNHADLLPGAREAHVQTAQRWFDHAASITTVPAVLDKATKLSASCDLYLQQPAALLEKLGRVVPENIPADSLIAMAYTQQGDADAAMTTLQCGLYQNVAVLLSQLTNYLQLCLADQVRFSQTVDRGLAVISAFAVKGLLPVSAANFLASAVIGTAGFGDAAHTGALLAQYAALLASMSQPLALHGDAYFDRVADWVAHTDQGGALPRNSGHLRAELEQAVLTAPAVVAMQAEPAVAATWRQLKEISNE